MDIVGRLRLGRLFLQLRSKKVPPPPPPPKKPLRHSLQPVAKDLSVSTPSLATTAAAPAGTSQAPAASSLDVSTVTVEEVKPPWLHETELRRLADLMYVSTALSFIAHSHAWRCVCAMQAVTS